MRYIWQTSTGFKALSFQGLDAGCRSGAGSSPILVMRNKDSFSLGLAMAIYGKSERSLEKAAARPVKPPHASLKNLKWHRQSATPFNRIYYPHIVNGMLHVKKHVLTCKG